MTNLARYISKEELETWMKMAVDEDGNPREGFTKSIPEGASTTLTAAFDPRMDAINGAYLTDCQVAKDYEPSGDFVSQANRVKPYAKDHDSARRFFDLANKLTGESF